MKSAHLVKKYKLFHNVCMDCGNKCDRQADRCRSCAAKNNMLKRTYNRPPKEQLIKDLLESKTYLALGAKHNVSNVTARKWCKYYGINKYNVN